MRQNPDNSIKPLLAESVDHPNSLTYVFNIRKGVHFWDGKELTAKDVSYSLGRELDPKSGAFWGVYFVNVKDIRETGLSQVTIDMKSPDEVFPSLLATYGGTIGEASYVESHGTSYGTASGGVMCTGPYKLQSWQPGQQIAMVRNDDYWDSAVKPKVGEVDFKFLTDPSTLANALQSNQIDGAYEVPVGAVTQLQSSTTGKLYTGPSTQWTGMLYTGSPGAFANSSVREALWLSIDKSALAKSVYQGTATPIRSANFPAVWGFGTKIFQAGYDGRPSPDVNLAEAQKLVQQAGATNGTVTLAAQSDDATAVQTAEIVQSAGKQIGLDVQLKLMAGPQISALQVDPAARKGIDIFLSARFIDIADPMQLLNEFLPDGQYNYANYNSPEFAQNVNDAYATGDSDQRAASEAKATTLLDNSWSILPLLNTSERLYLNSRVAGAPSSFGYLYYPWAQDLGSSK
ncbi:ABC transporter substrate-binding protein [Arthrobacter methylotrophus]|uniref:ABC transporter substrate-binding protein n=1 Tax=Arthrobacter methylotrophus TaxID=121291 RepID=A0ABV5USU3_9MICC